MAAGYHCPTSTSHSHHSAPPSRAKLILGLSCMFIIIIISVFAALTVLIVLQEREKPQFNLQQVGVQYLNVSVNGPTTASISFAIQMLFTAQGDTGHIPIEYGLSSFNITYRGIPLGCWATLPGFYLDDDSDVEQVQTSVTVDRVNLDSADLVRDASLYDRVELRIMRDFDVNMLVGFKRRTTTVSVDCVIAISPRKQALTYKLCGSDVLKV
ncbi:hypothetical protein OSB04_030183 [Centaurea solstitialis]|uniref:Late embryogenesis abundant protein LEA-2 subgroup domain-containing protein n=1 Tax=Centaurea solstitialis TaxID=347529 RepID=A0AA38S730_9ASTR|nr:hypothetical protein OSB04_030183 [Centaurea solstitialis]